MNKRTNAILVTVGIAGAAYVAYKLLTRPTNAGTFTHTNSKAVFTTAANDQLTNTADNVPLNNVGKNARTNKSGVHIRRDPAVLSFLGSGFLDNTDQVIDEAGTPIGNVVSVASDPNNPLQSWYRLDKTSTSFFHSGDPLYVNTKDVTF